MDSTSSSPQSQGRGASLPADFPKPHIPVLPVASFGTVGVPCGSSRPSVLDVVDVLYVTSGTAALALALRDAGIGPGDKVLVPAFHCRSMIEPVIERGASPIYYRIDDELAPVFGDIQEKHDRHVRAIIAVHYFGFVQDLEVLRRFCDTHDTALIEDCAHAFFGWTRQRQVGNYGDYVIASIRKFFPTWDGGVLASSRRSLERIRPGRPCGWDNIKAALDILEEAVEYARFRPFNYLIDPLVRAKRQLRSMYFSSSREQQAVSGTDHQLAYRYLDLARIDRRMSLPSRLFFRFASQKRLVRRRRQYYEQLARELADVPGSRVLFPVLPDGIVPYMFPFVIDDPDRMFPRLKRGGVPIYRWDDLVDLGCAVSFRYGQQLLQLPCHQELRRDEVNWMVNCIKKTLHDAWK